MYYERSFFHESAALFRERDVMRKYAGEWLMFEQMKQPIIFVDHELQPRELPPLPENFREALQRNAEAIAKLEAEHRELAERRRYDSREAS